MKYRSVGVAKQFIKMTFVVHFSLLLHENELNKRDRKSQIKSNQVDLNALIFGYCVVSESKGEVAESQTNPDRRLCI